MKILFLDQRDICIGKGGIYPELVNALTRAGHDVVLCCADKVYDKTKFIEEHGVKKIEIKVADQFGVNLIKKGLVIISLQRKFKVAIKRYVAKEQFDLVIYPTPPVTLAKLIKFCKKKFNCKSYLMLKDIFPQNAIDLGMLSKTGIKGLIYKYFRRQEKELYKQSDAIGCMSLANIDYVRKNNQLTKDKIIELFPNAVDVSMIPRISNEEKIAILEKLGVIKDKILFVYGGNLGKPQGLDFLEMGIKKCLGIKDAHFVIIGKGSEKDKLFKALQDCDNVTTLEALPKEEYDKLCAACNVGMVMLDRRFTIPNYPSRMLSYFENSMPIFACTDKNTDVRQLVEDQAQCGKWCYSDDLDGFVKCVEWFVDNKDKLAKLGENGYNYMVRHFNVEDNVKKLENFVFGKE